MYILVRLYYMEEQTESFLGLCIFNSLEEAISFGKKWKQQVYDCHDIDDYYFYIYKNETGVAEKVYDGLELDYSEEDEHNDKN